MVSLVSRALKGEKIALRELRWQLVEEMRVNDPEKYAQLDLSDTTFIDKEVQLLLKSLTEKNSGVTERVEINSPVARKIKRKEIVDYGINEL